MIEAEQEQQLLALYREHPCRTLPNPFWKTARQFGSSARLSLQLDQDDRLSDLQLWIEDRLMAYWCADPVQSKRSISEISSIPFALVHGDARPIFDAFDFSQREAYFRLICTKPIKPFLPLGFKFEHVDPSAETPAVAQIIKDCYQDMHVSDEIVRSWLDYPVYDPRLWAWMVEIASGKKVGLGIAEIDRTVPEASLEWIQVLPNYRRLGIGTALVRELCMRLWREVDFITVSGKVHSESQPEKLYRRCGFNGSDVWWLLVA